MSSDNTEEKNFRQVYNPRQRLESFQENINSTPRSRTYSDREKAETLSLLDSLGNLQEVSRLTGIPDSTISGWKYGIGAKSPDIPILRERINENLSPNLASDFNQIASLSARVAIKRLQSPQKANKIPFAQLMTGAGIAVDKMQLLLGQPTSISSTTMSETDRRLKVAELLSRIADRRQVKEIDITPSAQELHGPEVKAIESTD